MFNDGESIIPLVAILVLASLIAAILILQRLSADRKNVTTLKVEVEDYYDEECMGVVEVISGRKHVFPNTLIQQLDVKLEKHAPEIRFSVYITAEFNNTEFHFSQQQLAVFLVTMEKALPDFHATSARQALQHAISTGENSMIYVSQDYARDIAGNSSEA